MKLTIEEKVGQLFLIGITKKENIDEVLYLIKNYYIGGVIIYKNNYSNYEEMVTLINRLKEANKNNKIPLFISIDQENGRVNRFPKEFNIIKSQVHLDNASDNLVKEYGNITSQMLSETGINMNFSPVLDLKLFEDSHYIGNRAISSDPAKVTKVSSILINEFKNKDVISVAKHFPGHGSIKNDSHLFLPIIKNYSNILKSDIIPFENLIKKDIDAIMIGHILIKGETNNLPASISKKFITNIRKKYSYERLVVSDELSMRSVRYLYGKKKSIFLAADAGVDVIMYKYFKNLSNYINYLQLNYIKKRLSVEELDKSIDRILFVKRKYKINDILKENTLDIELINSKIEKLNQNL